MKVTFVGVGESCDERVPNTSLLVEVPAAGGLRTILLDCGFTAAARYWNHAADADELDGLWISHFHGDHFFGTPALLLRFWEMRRSKPLVVVGQESIRRVIEETMDLAYPNFRQKLTYPLDFIELAAEKPESILGATWQAAENDHSQRSLAVRIDAGGRGVFYSGDGRPTAETLRLARGCGLVVHEAYQIEGSTPGHGTVSGCVDFARRAGVETLALVHIQREVRRSRYQEILKVLAEVKDFHAHLPEPDDVLDV
jgi:ribonuclease BN (tRNA processing enzyme)